MADESIRVLLLDKDTYIPRKIAEFLNKRGFSVETANTGREAIQYIDNFKPEYILMDLLFPELHAVDLLEKLKTESKYKNTDITVMVYSGHNSAENVKKIFRAGARDYLVKPFKPEDILDRLIFQFQKKHQAKPTKKQTQTLEGAELYLHLMDLVFKEATGLTNSREKLFHLTQMVALTLKAVRCSIIQADLGRMEGLVVASSDDLNVKGIKLDLNRYPEVIHTISTEKLLAIENMDYNPELSRVKNMAKSIKFNSMIVVPIGMNDDVVGVLSARMDSNQKKITDLEIRFAQQVAYVASLIVNGADYLPLSFPKVA